MTPDEILSAVRDLLSDPKRWTQGAWARSADGTDCMAEDRGATCWCLGGAFSKVTGDEGFELSEEPYEPEVIEAWNRLRHVVVNGVPTVFEFNDQKDIAHGQILEALDRAIGAKR